MPVQQFDLSNKHTRFRYWPAIFALISLEAAAAAVYLARLPADPGGRFLGFSANRLALLAFLMVGALGFAAFAFRSRRVSWLEGWVRPQWRRPLATGLFLLLPLAALACLLAPLTLLSMYRTGGAFHYLAYYQRLLPLFAWGLAACLEILVGLAWSGAWHWRALKEQSLVWRAGLAVWVLFGLVGIFVAATGIGITPDRVGWGLPTVSLMEWQIGLAWVVGSGLLLWMAFRGWGARGDVLLAAAVWLLAAVLWLGQPIRPAFFAIAGRAPNFEIYPFSDGAYYAHFAQSALIGNGFKGGEIPARPMYVTLLAVFHLIAGQNYSDVITVQTLLLAFFPVVLFFLGRALHSRAVGVAIALMAILREVTAIYAMPITDNASNSKLFFADLPSALMISLWALIVVLWLKAAAQRPPLHPSRRLLPFLVGGSLGAAMLFRTQSVFMLPVALLLALLAYRWNWGRWLRAVGLVVLGLALTLSPWLLRNLSTTGRLAFDDDRSQTGSMAQRYSMSGTDERFVYQPGEDPEVYSRRVTQGIFDFLWTHPGFVAGFVSAHWLNAETANLLVLPVRSGITDLRELVMPLRPTWQDWNGALSPWQGLLFAVNAGMIALGIGACWARAGWAGLLPLLANLSYNFSHALARNSGGRYLLPVDWVMYAYAAVGLLEITLAALAVLGVSPGRLALYLAAPNMARREDLADGALQGKQRPGISGWLAGVLIGLGFVLYGSLPWLVEQLIPARYPQQSRAELVREVLHSAIVESTGLDHAALERFTAQPGVVVVKGRALYPRYYDRGDGEPLTAKTGYEPLDYARTVFLVTAKTYNGLAILKAPTVPDHFPHPADVIIIGCPAGTYLDARLVLVLDGAGSVYTADSGFPETCPSVEGQTPEAPPGS